MTNVKEIIKLIQSSPEAYITEIDQMLSEASLVSYIEVMWEVLEPGRHFCHGWHIDAICDHMEAINNREIKRLLINVPPGSSKPVYEMSDVITRNGCKKLKDVVVGDEILTHTGHFKKVDAVHVQGDLPTLTFTTHNGRTLTTAFDHPILTTRGWVQAKDITLKDSLIAIHQKELALDKINENEENLNDSLFYADKVEKIEESGLKPCRCLTVDEDHSFVANGIAVHNSLITQVFYPSWVWGPKNKPWRQFLGFSYSQRLAERDNVKCRTLLRSPKYQKLWGNQFSLTRDTNSKKKFSNDKNGFKEVSSVGGTSTGLRADDLMVDDPHSVKQGDSEADMKTALLWFNETLPTRLNSQVDSTITVIMQRIKENDISGEILSKDLGYTHLMIPMYFEPERRCYTVVHPGGYKAADDELYMWDKRQEDGELMCPELFPKSEVEKLASQLGTYAVAGQLQQRPVPREGAMFKVDNIQFVDLKDVPEGIEVRGWDIAGSTSSSSPFTAGVKIRFTDNNNFYVMDSIRFRGEERRVVTEMKKIAESDGIECIQDFPQDPGQAGKGQAVFITEQLAGFVVKSSLESGSKTVRAEAMATQAGINKMFIVRGAWNENYIKELTTFPGCRFKDQIDASTRAFHRGISLINKESSSNICAPISV